MWRYYIQWVRTAFSIRKSFILADSIAGAISIFSPIVLLLFVPERYQDNKLMQELAWQIPLGALGILTFSRIFLAPYWIHRDSQNQIARLEASQQLIDDEVVRRKGQARLELGVRIIEGREVINAISAIDASIANVLPREEFKKWRDDTTSSLLSLGFIDEYPLWAKDTGISIKDAARHEYEDACFAGMGRLEQILKSLRD